MTQVKNFNDQEASLKIREIADKIKVCMFCTKLNSLPFSTRPMNLAAVDTEGKLWFLSDEDSNKNIEIEQDEKVQLIFSGPLSAQFLSIYGEADIYKDRKSIEKIWTSGLNTWFQGGKDDPALSAIRIHPLDAYYWDSMNEKMISLIKIAASALNGKKMEGITEGQLTVDQSKY